MALDPRKVESVRRRQREMFSKALDRRTYNMTIKEIADLSGLDDTSISNYAGGVTTMSLTALDALVDVLPDELLSILLPDRLIVKVPHNVDHDAIADWAAAYQAKSVAAHRKDSECEERLGPNELIDLDNTVVQFPGMAA